MFAELRRNAHIAKLTEDCLNKQLILELCNKSNVWFDLTHIELSVDVLHFVAVCVDKRQTIVGIELNDTQSIMNDDTVIEALAYLSNCFPNMKIVVHNESKIRVTDLYTRLLSIPGATQKFFIAL